MSDGLPAHFIELVCDAALKSFWYKKTLRRFLRRCHIAESFLSQLSENESKRDWLDRLIPKLEATERGQGVIKQMAVSLADQTCFPDLEKLEDSRIKIKEAKLAIDELKSYLQTKKTEQKNEESVRRNREEAQAARNKIQRSVSDLAALRERLEKLSLDIGTQVSGYAFQSWFYDLMSYSEIDNRRPYIAPDCRQIDGSITVDGTTYLVELKFSAEQTSPADIDSVLAKVNTKSDNTMGLMVSMSGFNPTAIKQSSFAKSPLLLIDHAHLFAVLIGSCEFSDVVRRVRRHSSQTGEAYLHPSKFGGK